MLGKTGTLDDNGRTVNARMHSSVTLSTIGRKLASRQSQKKANQRPGAEYRPVKVIGQGAFGVVYCAKWSDGSLVAVKKVLLDPRFKNRELETMMLVHNRYVVELKNHFKTAGRKPKEVYLNLVMEYLPLSLHQFNMNYRKERKYPPLLYVKLFAFQMFAGLNYLHSIEITHRDLKPQNMLVDTETGVLKICDLGSAKKLLPDERSVSYIASRYYRAPELILDCTYYTPAIDIWASGCCLAEMLMAGMPLFAGASSLAQLSEIVKVLGPPEQEDLRSFQHSEQIEIPQTRSTTLEQVLPRHTPSDVIDLLKEIFVYSPKDRPSAYDCMQHPCFDEIFESSLRMPSQKPFPVLERHPEPIV
jgi:glycogen synthase kinase 3 beta